MTLDTPAGIILPPQSVDARTGDRGRGKVSIAVRLGPANKGEDLVGHERSAGPEIGGYPVSWLALGIFLSVAILGGAFVARAAEGPFRLTEAGTELGARSTTGNLGDMRFSVVVDGDAVASTHVWAIVGGTQLRQRTNEGYWIPWNGRTESLIDNRFPVVDGRIEFKVFDGSLGSENQGIAFLIGYRVGAVLKYGILGVTPAGGS